MILLPMLIFSGFGAVVAAAGSSSAYVTSSSTSPPPSPDYFGGTAASETAIWWAWGLGGTSNDTLYLYTVAGCSGKPVTINVPFSDNWQYDTTGLSVHAEYYAQVTEWAGGVQSPKSSCVSAETNAPAGVLWSNSATGASTTTISANTTIAAADTTSKELSIQATDPTAGQFVIWASASTTAAYGWYWEKGAWTPYTSTANGALIAAPLAASDLAACMAWDPALSGYLTVLGPSATHNNWFTYLFSGGVWSNKSATITMPGNYAANSEEPCNMAYDSHNSEMVLLATAFVGTSPMPEYTFTFSGGTSWTNASGTAGTFYGVINNGNGPTSSTMLAYDSTDSELVFTDVYQNALNSRGVYPVGTWTFSGGTWTNRSALPNQPYPLADGGFVSAAWDGGYVVIGGGNDSTLACGQDTGAPYVYLFRGNAWTNISSGGKIAFPATGCEYEDWGSMGGAIGPNSTFVYGGAVSTSAATTLTGNVASFYLNATGSTPSPNPYTPSSPPGNLSVTNPGSGNCYVSTASWSNPSAPTGEALTGDVVYVYDGSGNVVADQSTGPPTTSWALPSLSLGSSFLVAVQAFFTGSTQSPVSGVLQFVSGCVAGSLSFLSSVPFIDLLAIVLVIATSVTVAYGLSSRKKHGGRRVGGRP